MPRSFAPAKVNLYLHVTGRRDDGYHLLDSLAVFAGVGDIVAAAPAETLSLTIDGPFAAMLKQDTDNLVLRAARAARIWGSGPSGGAALTLTKNLPVASGIGGGSADAAAALRCLHLLWNTTAAPAVLAPRLGADVPVCVPRLAARMSGIGDILAPAPGLPPFGLVLLNPGAAVSTQAVFKSRTGPVSAPAALPAAWPTAAALAATLLQLHNDLEPPAILLQPIIADVLATLRAVPGALLARMSGSGATCFALFETAAAARSAAASCARPGWWAWGGGLYEPAGPDL